MTTWAAPTRSRWIGRRILCHIGPIEVHSYKVMLYLGCVAGVFAGSAIAGERGLDESRFALVTIGLLAPAMAGARLWFVARHRHSYRAGARQVARRAEGGAGLYGGLVVSVAVSVPVLALAGMPLGSFWDAAIVTMLVGAIVTRLGCLMNGCCAGRPTGGKLGVWLPNTAGEWRRRYPTQVLEAVWAGLLLVAALLARNAMPFDGALFAGVIGVYCAGRVLLQGAREA